MALKTMTYFSYLLFIWLLLWSQSYTEANNPCSITRSGLSSVIADCKNRNLTYIPPNLPRDVTDLLLSRNKLNILPKEPLNFPYLINLDLSHNEIGQLNIDSFDNVTNLEYLDLSFNEINHNDETLPVGVFQKLYKLQTLKISSQNSQNQNIPSGNVIGQLRSLKKFVFTVIQSDDHIFSLDSGYSQMTSLESLVIFGYLCRLGHLGNESLRELRNSPLTNLTIRNCNIQSLDPLVFQYFPHLEHLNLAINVNIGLASLMTALKNSPQMRLHTLIADNVQGSVCALTPDDFCIPALKELRRLSIRHNDIFQINAMVLKCFMKLEYIAVGFNPILSGIPENWRPILDRLINQIPLITFDGSFLMHIGTGIFYDIYRYPIELDTEDYIKKPPPELWPDVFNNETIPFHHFNSSKHLPDLLDNVPATWKVLFVDHIMPNSLFNISDLKENEDNHILYINISFSGAISIRPPLLGFHRLQIFDGSHNKISLIGEGALDHMPNLKKLYLQNNILGQQPDQFNKVFNHLGSLELLDLSANKLPFIHKYAFSGLYNLIHLDLSQNFLSNISFLLQDNDNLKHLDLSRNKITYLLPDFIKQLDSIAAWTPLEVDLKGNPFECLCASLPFLEWFRSTNVTIPGKESLTCTINNTKNVGLLAVDLKKLSQECAVQEIKNLPLVILAPITACILIVAISSLLYHYRWHVRWHFYLLRRRIRIHNHTFGNDSQTQLSQYRYRAFVAHNHDADMQWVLTDLLPKAEDEWGLRICIGYRDFMPGIPIVENIVEAIDNSYRTLLIVTPHFVQSEWCDFETHMALTKGRGHVVVCLMNPVPFEDMNATLRALIQLNNYIEWAEDAAGKQLFWERLRVALTEDDDLIE